MKYDESPNKNLKVSTEATAPAPPAATDDAFSVETGDAGQPLVLIPVEAEDVLRRRRRRITVITLATIVIALIGALIYKLSVDPINAREAYDAGTRLLKIGRYSQAVISFDRAIALKRGFSDAYWARGHAYVSLEQADNAIRDFTKVIQLLPREARPLVDRGQVYLSQKDYQGAIDDASQAIDLDPKLGSAYALHGLAVRATGNVQASLQDFDKAVQFDANASNYYERGATYQLLGRHREAIADFTEMIRYRPDAATGWFARAESERAVGEMEAAQADHHQGRIIDGR